MFRIVQFKLPYKQFIDACETGSPYRSSAEGIQENTKIQSIKDAKGVKRWYTEAMATTSAKFFLIESYTRSIFGDPPHLIEDLTDQYALLRTRAPVDYDYGYVIEIGKMPGEFGEERLVAMPKESVNYQSGRYSSGMYTPIDCK